MLIGKQSHKVVLMKKCFENMWQIYREHPYQSVILAIEITHRHGCSPINLQRVFRTLFYENFSGGCLLDSSDLEKMTQIFC